MDPQELLNILLDDSGPALTLALILAVVAFWRGWVKPGRDSAEWQRVAERYADTLQQLVPTVDRLADSLSEVAETQQDLKRIHEIDAEVRRVMGARGNDETPT